jgi:hypothetical protein
MAMRSMRWPLFLGIALVVISVIVYLIHYAIFRDSHHIWIFMVSDIAFVPIEVLLVTLIIHRLLRERERRNRLEKLNMVIGAFFSAAGTRLLTHFSDYDPNLDRIRGQLIVTDEWSEPQFTSINERLRKYDYAIDIDRVNLVELRDFLVGRKDLLLRTLENPTLIEHETFTELLQAVFHLSEELESRDDLLNLPGSDRQHLANDIKRAYVLLVRQWLAYARYLKANYPYLFSLAMRLNPFDLEASPLVA